MLRTLKTMLAYEVRSHDEKSLGELHDIYFDDRDWKIRYAVIGAAVWLSDRQVLISPEEIVKADADTRKLTVRLTREQVRHSPPVEAGLAVNREHERELASYYGWEPYWASAPVIGSNAMEPADDAPHSPEAEAGGDPHLRGMNGVLGYTVHATDKTFGSVGDFIACTENWRIEYLVIDTRKWLPGKKVLLPPHLVQRLDWDKRNVYLDMTCDQIKNSPKFDPSAPVNVQREVRLYDFEGKTVD